MTQGLWVPGRLPLIREQLLVARKERFLCGYNAYVGDCSGFKNRRLGRKGIFHSAISRRYKHGAHLSFLCYLLLCYGYIWERRHACFSQEPILTRIQSVKRSVVGALFYQVQRGRLGLRHWLWRSENWKHTFSPHRKWWYHGGLVEMRRWESTCKKVQLGLAIWLSGWKCFPQAGWPRGWQDGSVGRNASPKPDDLNVTPETTR